MTPSFPPPLSVVMPVRDALPYLDEAVESILGQSFSNFEFIILDDYSSDGSRERLREWAAKDRRIRLIESDTALGPVGSSNRVVAEAHAPFVARMDADDVAHPDRFRRQLQLIRRNPDAVLVGSTWEGIDGRGKVVREPDRSGLGKTAFGAPMAHGSILFRRDAFLAAGGYRQDCAYWEDLDLYARIAGLGRILVSAETLYRHRFSETSTRLTSGQEKVEDAVDFMFRFARAYERGDPQPLRAAARPAGERLRPETFLSLGSLKLWAGERPHALQRLIARGALRADRATLKALMWAAWAEAHPRSLRWLMRALLRWRNDRSGVGTTGTFEWRPRAGLSGFAAAPAGNSAGPGRTAAGRRATVPAGGRDG